MDNADFGEAISSLHSTIYRVAYSYTRNYADAEEITQEAFLKLYLCEKVFSSKGDMKAWLIRITINLSVSLLRSGWRKRRAELPEKEIPAPEAHKIDSDGLRELVVKLTPEQMTAVYLHYYEGYSLKEIGKMCGTTAASVSMRLARARARLKTMLTEDDYE